MRPLPSHRAPLLALLLAVLSLAPACQKDSGPAPAEPPQTPTETSQTTPGAARQLLNEAYTLMQQEKLEAAGKKFHEATERFPGDGEAWAALGAYHAAHNRFDEAIVAYEQAVDTGLRAGPMQALAGIYTLLNLPLQAEQTARTALEEDPTLPLARLHLTQALLRQGQTKAAIQNARRGVDLLPRDPGLWAALGQALAADGDLDGARKTFEESAHLSPDNPQATLGLANLLLEEQGPEQAEALLRGALQRRPDPSLRHALAQLLLRRNHRLDEAVTLLEDAVEENPGHPVFQETLARAYLENGTPLKAIPLLETLTTRQPENPALWLHLTRAYAQSGNAAKGLATLQAAMAEDKIAWTDTLREQGMALQRVLREDLPGPPQGGGAEP